MSRVLAAAVTALVVASGVWVTGAVLTNNATAAMLLTGAWFALAGGLAVLVAWRRRWLAAPVLAAWLVTSSVLGGFLLWTSSVDAERVHGASHPTSGRAALIERPDGARVVTLTRFDTDPGPDLRGYVVAGDGSSVEGAVDLGALKGNKGDQQYDVPPHAPDGAVVIWCRAFTVAFGAAKLS